MPQPEFVPVKPVDKVRAESLIPSPDEWRADRPAEIKSVFAPAGDALGTPGPDQGYVLKLARSLKPSLKLAKHEHSEDAIAGCIAVALRRAASFGRAPVIYDLELAFTLWGFLGEPPEDLVEYRKPLFEAASHHYWDQREIASLVPESTLRLSHTEVAARQDDWRELINV